MNNVLKVYCDECGDSINENEENNCVIFKHIASETLVFCDSDCRDNFVNEYTYNAYIDIHGTIFED